MHLTIAIFAFFSALGITYDKLAFNKHKLRVHGMMVNWWYKIGTNNIPDFKKNLLSKYLRTLINFSNLKILSFRFFISSAVISWVFTTMGAIVGEYIQQDTIGLPFYNIYVANYPFDILTILFTLHILKLILNENKIIKIFILVTVNIIVNYILTIFCLVTISLFLYYQSKIEFKNDVFNPYDTKGFEQYLKKEIDEKLKQDSFTKNVTVILRFEYKSSLKESLLSSVQNINDALALKAYRQANLKVQPRVFAKEAGRRKSYILPLINCRRGTGAIYGALSTLLPSILLLSLIFILAVSKSIIEIAKFIAVLFLDKVTETGIDKSRKLFDSDKFIPGTLTGVLLGFISSFLVLLNEIILRLR